MNNTLGFVYPSFNTQNKSPLSLQNATLREFGQVPALLKGVSRHDLCLASPQAPTTLLRRRLGSFKRVGLADKQKENQMGALKAARCALM